MVGLYSHMNTQQSLPPFYVNISLNHHPQISIVHGKLIRQLHPFTNLGHLGETRTLATNIHESLHSQLQLFTDLGRLFTNLCILSYNHIHKPRLSMGNSSVGTPTLVSTTGSNNWLTIHKSPPFVKNHTLSTPSSLVVLHIVRICVWNT